MRPFAARGPFGDVVQQSQFAPAIDQRDPSAVRLRTSAKPEDRPRDQVVLESFRSDLTQVAELDETASELDGRLPGQDLAGLGGLLQPRSRVDLCPDHDVAIGRRADRHRTGVDTDPNPHREREVELCAESFGPFTHRPRGADRAHRVVVVRHRDPEDTEDGVADEPLGDAAHPCDLLRDHPVVGGDDLTEPFGIKPRRELGRAGQVDEHDGDDPSLGGRRDRDRRPAVRTEVRRLRERLPAAGTELRAHE